MQQLQQPVSVCFSVSVFVKGGGGDGHGGPAGTPLKDPQLSTPHFLSQPGSWKAAQPNASVRDTERARDSTGQHTPRRREREREKAESKGSGAGSLGGGLRRWAKGEKERGKGEGKTKERETRGKWLRRRPLEELAKPPRATIWVPRPWSGTYPLRARVCVCVFELSYRHSPCVWLIAVNSVHVKVISSPPDPGSSPLFFLKRRQGGEKRRMREMSM